MTLTIGIRKVLVLLVVFALLVGLYAIVGFFVAPRVLRSQIETFAAETFQREVMLGDIHFNPFTLTLEMRGVSFPDVDARPLFGFDRLHLNIDVSSIWKRGASFELIELDQPFGLAVVRRDGTLNFADLAKPFPATDDEPVRAFIELLRVMRGKVDFEDQTRPSLFRAKLEPVTFALRDFNTVDAGGNSYALDAQSTDGGRFRWNGSFGLTPFAAKGEFTLTDVPTQTLWSYLKDSLPFVITSGAVDLDGNYNFAAADSGVTLVVGVKNVAVNDLGIAPRNGKEDYVRLTSLTVQDSRFDLARSRMEIGAVKIAGGELHVWREPDARVNLLELMESAPAPETPQEQTVPSAEAASASPEWFVSAPDIAIDQLKIALEDRLVKPAATFELNPVAMRLQGFTNQPNQLYDMEASVVFARGGKVELTGQALPERASFRGKVNVADLTLLQFQPYIGTYSQLTLLNGAVSAKLEIERPESGELRIAGDTQVVKLHTVDTPLRHDFMMWDRLEVAGIDFRLPVGSPMRRESTSRPKPDPVAGPGSLKIATINAQRPYIRFIIAPDQTTNVGTILTAPPGAPGPVQTVKGPGKETPAENPQPLKMSIGKVNIRNGSGNFADFWIQPNYAVSIQQLNGSISGLSSDPASRAKLTLDGKIDRYAPAKIEGEVNLLSASLFTALKVDFKGVELSSVTPYSGRFAGYRIEKGKLSVELEYHVENRKLDAKQRFVIDQLQLGERVESPDAVKLPLKLAVALLKDSNGVIDLGLPVTGSLDDPKFRLGPIIWKAFLGLLTKIATSPFKLLGSLFGGDEEMNLVDFAPGSAVLEPAAQQRLAGLVKGMKERPGLQLDVPAVYSTEVDGAALATQAVDEKLAEGDEGKKKRGTDGAESGASADPAQRFEQLVAQFRAEFGEQTALPGSAPAVLETRKKKRDPQMLATANGELEQALREKTTVPPEALEALGQSRARAIQDALLAGGEVDPQRVFLIAPEAKPPVEGKVRIELSLK